ncbi:preATP grasp domain-containing protein [Catelliglobosispora koreensis]|uniref:preATP grasp domain-containing protein n=1 Tax=Catelliglobosispora koreensis TaxID=129052 RepID=UPI000379F814|nr:hypothetical protein [Catelliglobosispora koreensis]
MRILIGNHIDPAIRDRGDLRTWTQRVFWFARNGDVVILSAEPDNRFLSYVCNHLGIDQTSLHVIVSPEGPHRGLLLDPETLTSPQLLQAVTEAIGSERVDEIFPLWPSDSVARFADALGLRDRLPAADFLSQRGGELCNNKALFRAIAAASGTATPAGTVCHDMSEAIQASSDLIARTGAVMVKQAHNGAGMGNQLLLADETLSVGHVGARHLHLLSGSDIAALEAYWSERWVWASAERRFPVVVEEYVPGAQTIYSEHFASDDGTQPTEAGSLHYVGRRLSYQIVPLRHAASEVQQQLLDGGTQLADAYQRFGYRGYLSADAIVTPSGDVLFTEVNAQVSGSLHIYQAIANGIVRVSESPRRAVTEYHVPPTWAVPDWKTFIAEAERQGTLYDPKTRTGVIVSMPIEAQVPGIAQFVFCVAYGSEFERDATLAGLDHVFNGIPDGTYDASERVGVPAAASA